MNELKTLLPYVRPYRGGILLGLLLVLLANVFGILIPELVGRAVDSLNGVDLSYDRIVSSALIIVGVSLLTGASRFGMRQLLNGISRRIEVDLRDAFFAQLMRLDSAFYSRNRTGDLMSRATNDTVAVRQAAGPAVMYLVNTLVTTVFVLAMMLRVSVELTLWSLIPLVFLPPVTLILGRITYRRAAEIQDHLGVISTLVQENLSGVRIVRAYVQEQAQEREFDQLNQAYLEKNMSFARIQGLFFPVLTLLVGAGLVIVFWFGGRLVMADRISIGDFVKFNMFLGMLAWPMISLGWVTNLFQRGAAAMSRINRIMATPSEVLDAESPAPLDAVRGEIEFDDVGFSYPDSERAVLDGITFRIPAGATAALVGPTGAGKSTMVALIARLFDPIRGEIRLDGVPLRNMSLERLRGAIGVVPQDAFVFSDTIGANIALGLDAEDQDARIRHAAAVARLAETVEALPAGYDTRLGERGINLSGGQRQRATLARALARDPAILVLDDALSAVDTHTETEILTGLRDMLADRTSLIISHRVTAVMNADLILVLAEGRIVERGTHAELIESGGLYATLLRRQLLEEDLESDGDPLAAGSERA